MKRLLFTAALLAGSAAVGAAADFAAPVRLKAGAAAIRVEAPGYACPCWADVDGDGKKELVVGQFAQGKMRVYKYDGQKFSPGEWIKAEGKVAQVPGVW